MNKANRIWVMLGTCMILAGCMVEEAEHCRKGISEIGLDELLISDELPNSLDAAYCKNSPLNSYEYLEMMDRVFEACWQSCSAEFHEYFSGISQGRIWEEDHCLEQPSELTDLQWTQLQSPFSKRLRKTLVKIRDSENRLVQCLEKLDLDSAE